jgi:TolA-binding protein
MVFPSHLGSRTSEQCPSRIASFPVCRALVCFTLVLGTFEPGMSSAQTPASSTQPDGGLSESYKSAMEAFGRGEYPAAIATFEGMLTKGADGPGMEHVRFSLAAALYNAKDYKKSRAKFEEYLKLHPQAAKASDAMLAVGQCQLALGDKAGSAKTFAAVAQQGGANRDQALLAGASLLKAAKKSAEAVAMVQPILSGGIRSPESVQAAMFLAALEAEKGNHARTFQIVESLHGRPDLIDNPLELNALTFEVGDIFLAAKEFKKALRAYSLVRNKDEVIALQRNRIAALNTRIEANITQARAEPLRGVELLEINNRLKTSIESLKSTIAEVEKAPSNLLALRMRQARCYQEAGRQWEAVLLYESLLGSGSIQGLDEALFSLGVAHSELGNSEESIAALERCAKEFPKGKNADSALFLEATQLLRKDKFEAALPVFTRLLAGYPKSKVAEQSQFFLGNTNFALSQYAKAIEAYNAYLKLYPKGDHIEEVTYRVALCYFQLGNYELALPALTEHREKYPTGPFAADASYRVAVCYFSAKDYKRVLQMCEDWDKDFGFPSLRGEVLSLKGDALAALGQRADAVVEYRQAVAQATSDSVVQYALFEANKQLQRLSRWDLSTEMFQEFIASRPDHPATVSAIHWLTRAMVKEGKTAEAKQYLSTTILSVLEDRSRDAVEQLLSQLAQLCAKRPPGPATPAGQSADSEKPEAAQPPAYDAAKEMALYLDPAKVPNSPLAKARILFAQAELARLTKHPEESEAALDRICSETPPTVLGASLLAQSGDRMFARGKMPQARAFYQELLKAFPKSELLDFSYNGLGQLALLDKQFEKAIQLFDDAIDKAGASTKLKDVTLGKGKALLGLGRHEEAKAIFEQVATTREWKGESTAEAVYLIGEVLFQKGEYEAAVQYFQRVFVAYQRYSPTVVKAYVRAADCFDKLGSPEKANAHYRELLAKKKLSAFPECDLARKRLAPAPTP